MEMRKFSKSGDFTIILVDYSNISFASIIKGIKVGDSDSEDGVILSPSYIIGKLRGINVKFREKYGELVICNDSRSWSWRKKFYPYYKIRRANKKRTDEDQAIFEKLCEIQAATYDTLNRLGPYRCVEVTGGEGDDIMASLSLLPGQHVIITADKDLSQLNAPNIKTWNPLTKDFVDNGVNFDRFLTMDGDTGDDVPNFLSDDDTFANETKRQRPLREKVRTVIMNAIDPEMEIPDLVVNGTTPEQLLANWKRNEKLVNLRKIPKIIKEKAVEKFNDQADTRSPKKLLDMFSELRCGFYVSKSNDFVVNRDG